MSSLLEEAIVDAKALKEAALKNAEDAVLEKYSGEVKRALDTLLEQDEMGLEEEEADGEDLMEFTEGVPYAFANEEIGGPVEEEIVEIDFDALKERLAEEDAAVEGTDLIDATALADTLEESSMEVDPSVQTATLSDPADAADEREDEEESATAATRAAPSPMSLEEDEDINLTEDMIADLIEELTVDMTPRPQGWSAQGSAYNSVLQANDEAMAAAAANALNDEEEEEEEVQTVDTVSDSALFETKISELTDSNKELRALIMEAKDQLMQLNLDNAKLVYQNKALNSASLNERQKKQIVEAVQSANSVEETGMIFETIQNAVGSAPVQRTRPQTLREAVQRPTSLLLNSKKNNEVTIDPNMGRMLRLAGLNK
tara:strand:+ start:1205 stop:2323 length:1119 start_codon:yes stop_codon:yes gene_type:complete